MNYAVSVALNKVFQDAIKHINVSVIKYIMPNSDILKSLVEEIRFTLRVSEYLQRVTEAGLPLTVPDISSDKYELIGIYNPFLIGKKSAGDIILNNIAFDENARIYILTGANNGGKSIFTIAIGITQRLLQCGIPIPATKATMTVCDFVLPYVPLGDTDANQVDMIKKSAGRLETEVKAVMGIIELATARSLVLMDEAFTSTSESDAVELAKSALIKLGNTGCKCVFTTHLHRLVADTEEINSKMPTGIKVDNLSAEVVEGKRTYRISRTKPQGSSYAKDIASKYGLL